MTDQLQQHTLQKAKEHYDREGYAIFRNVLDTGLVREASNHIEWLLERNPGVRPEQLGHRLVANDPFWVRLVSDDRLLDVAEQFIGPNIALFASHYISKRPYDGQAVLWHQDGTYWPLEPMEVVTLWLAIDDSTPENGCVRVIPGTQHTRLLKREELLERDDGTNVLASGMDPSQIDESQAVDLILKAGDVSVHHPNVIHGSNANTSPQRRAGLTIRYIPTSTRTTDDEPWPLFLLRGEPAPGGSEYLPFPRYVAGKHMPFRGCEAWQ
jgi:phytanoyl-CoA hydroxylase